MIENEFKYMQFLNEDFFDELNSDELIDDKQNIDVDDSNAYQFIVNIPEKHQTFSLNDMILMTKKLFVYLTNEPVIKKFDFVIGQSKKSRIEPKDRYDDKMKKYMSGSDEIVDFATELYNSRESVDATYFIVEYYFNHQVLNVESFTKMFVNLLLLVHKHINKNSSIRFNYNGGSLVFYGSMAYAEAQRGANLIYYKILDLKYDLENIKDIDYSKFYVKPDFKYNGPHHLSPLSKKQISSFKTGDILYADENNNLVSQKGKGCTPIAIYVNKLGDKHYFQSLRIATTNNTYGTTLNSMHDYINTSFNTKIHIDLINEYFNIDLMNNYDNLSYEQFLDFFNNCGIFGEKHWRNGPLVETSNPFIDDKTNQINVIYPTALNAAYMFRTPGTKTGDWMIPSYKEIFNLFFSYGERAKKINKVRQNLGHNPLNFSTYDITFLTTSLSWNGGNYGFTGYNFTNAGHRLDVYYAQDSLYVLPYLIVVE